VIGAVFAVGLLLFVLDARYHEGWPALTIRIIMLVLAPVIILLVFFAIR